jgi:hypothetical protein
MKSVKSVKREGSGAWFLFLHALHGEISGLAGGLLHPELKIRVAKLRGLIILAAPFSFRREI